jgi:predicted permease
MADPKSIYRLLLKLYPAHFREEYERPLERQFWDEYNEIQGTWARTMFWIRALMDLAVSIPVEILHELRQDLSYAVRVYRRRSFTVVLALVALALTIGITTGVFSVVNALLFRSLPFHEPDRLVLVQDPRGYNESPAVFHAWATSRSYITDAAGYRTENMTLGTTGQALRVKVAETTSNFFSLLGSQPLIGRAFDSGEDTPGRTDVAVVSHGLWQQLGGDPRILGSTIRVNGVPLTVVGVGPKGLDYPGKAAIWVPSLFHPGHLSRVRALIRVVNGRLRPGISIQQASAHYRAETIALAKPTGFKLAAGDLSRLRLVPLRDQLAGNVRRISLVLFGLVLFVLLTACANLAHLLLSRVTERRKELLLRAALGASRGRLVQQLITETTVLTLAAAAGGLIVAQWAARLASTVRPPSLTVQAYTVLDWPVLLFAMGIAVLTGLIFGVLPAGFIRRMQLNMDPLRIPSGGHNAGIRRLRAGLVALQASFTVVLLAGALTMCRSFLKLAGTDLGLRTDHVVTMNVALSGTAREKNAPAYYREALERLRGVPGVEYAGAVEFLPLEPNNMAGFRFKLDGAEDHFGVPITATPDYLRATGTNIIAGRDFTAAEEAESKPVAIVNEAFARQFDPALHVVGKRLIPAFGDPLTIIGVAHTQRYSPTDDGMAVVYRAAGWSPALNMTLVARVQGKAELYKPICRDAVRGIDPTVPVYNVATMDERLRETLSGPRFYTTMVLFFSGFALLLAILGTHGVASFAIQQRTHEIGVRLAIGAQPLHLRVALLREALLPVGGGLLLGMAAAVAFGKLLENLMEAVDPVGFPICIAAGAVLVAMAAIDIWTATRRIVRMDPMKVLRAD